MKCFSRSRSYQSPYFFFTKIIMINDTSSDYLDERVGNEQFSSNYKQICLIMLIGAIILILVLLFYCLGMTMDFFFFFLYINVYKCSLTRNLKNYI